MAFRGLRKLLLLPQAVRTAFLFERAMTKAVKGKFSDALEDTMKLSCVVDRFPAALVLQSYLFLKLKKYIECVEAARRAIPAIDSYKQYNEHERTHLKLYLGTCVSLAEENLDEQVTVNFGSVVSRYDRTQVRSSFSSNFPIERN